MKEHRILSQRQEAAAENALFEAIQNLEDLEELRAFFQDLCTPAELQAMKDRWLVVKLLSDGKSYREVRAESGVSLTTVGRVARYLESGAGGYKAALERLGKSLS